MHLKKVTLEALANQIMALIIVAVEKGQAWYLCGWAIIALAKGYSLKPSMFSDLPLAPTLMKRRYSRNDLVVRHTALSSRRAETSQLGLHLRLLTLSPVIWAVYKRPLKAKPNLQLRIRAVLFQSPFIRLDEDIVQQLKHPSRKLENPFGPRNRGRLSESRMVLGRNRYRCCRHNHII